MRTVLITAICSKSSDDTGAYLIAQDEIRNNKLCVTHEYKKTGELPLNLAIRLIKPKFIKLLLEKGEADPLAQQSKDGANAIDTFLDISIQRAQIIPKRASLLKIANLLLKNKNIINNKSHVISIKHKIDDLQKLPYFFSDYFFSFFPVQFKRASQYQVFSDNPHDKNKLE